MADDNQLKTILNEQREEYQRYLGILAEDFKSSLKMVAESVSGLQEQLTAVRDLVVQNTEDVSMIKLDIQVMKTDVGFIKNSLKQKVDLDEFTALEQRVALLERR